MARLAAPRGALHELSRSIGQLETGVATIAKATDDDREEAKTYRREM